MLWRRELDDYGDPDAACAGLNGTQHDGEAEQSSSNTVWVGVVMSVVGALCPVGGSQSKPLG